MDKYRSKIIDEQMLYIEKCLSSIVAKEFQNLRIKEIFDENRKDNPELSLNEAIMLGMQGNAVKALKRVIAMATCFDRIIVMVSQMVSSIENKKLAQRYIKRLEVLTDFNRTMKELTPAIDPRDRSSRGVKI